MRVLFKLLLYAAALGALCWLASQMAASFNRATAATSTPDASRAYALFSAYLIASAVLGGIVAWDVSRLFGWQAGSLFFGGGRVAAITPAWWKAERLCKAGQPLEAVRTLRDYLATHPRQWRVAVRIAEIYERELQQPLPAALEYESLLKLRLTPQVRAELLLRLAACHLLRRQSDESAAVLQQVISEFPKTAAAQKAVRRLNRLELGAARTE
jgi:hypothetical protein